MDWVKLSATYYLDPAVASLPDADTELLFVRGLAYCGAQETGGFIPAEIIPSLIRRRRYGAAVEALVARSLWVPSSGTRGQPGYRVARWEDWQEELEALARRRAADRDRKRRERSRKDAQVKGVSRDMSAGPSAERPHTEKESKRQIEPPLGDQRAEDQSVRAGARGREATRHLHDRYGLTDQEATRVISEVEARAREPIKHLVKYLRSMAEGDLADIANAAMDRYPPPPDPEAPPTLRAVPDPVEPCPAGQDPYETGPAKARAAFLEAKKRKASS